MRLQPVLEKIWILWLRALFVIGSLTQQKGRSSSLSGVSQATGSRVKSVCNVGPTETKERNLHSWASGLGQAASLAAGGVALEDTWNNKRPSLSWDAMNIRERRHPPGREEVPY